MAKCIYCEKETDIQPCYCCYAPGSLTKDKRRIKELEAEIEQLKERNKILEEDIVLKHQAYKEMNKANDAKLAKAEDILKETKKYIDGKCDYADSGCLGCELWDNIQDYFKGGK